MINKQKKKKKQFHNPKNEWHAKLLDLMMMMNIYTYRSTGTFTGKFKFQYTLWIFL